MFKKLILLIMSAVMLISSAAVPGMAQDTMQPIIGEPEIAGGNFKVEVTGATDPKLIVTHNDSTGKLIVDGESNSINNSILSVPINSYNSSIDYDFFVLSQNGASLKNAPPMPVGEDITVLENNENTDDAVKVSAKIKYVKLDWETPADDFSAVEKYIIKRYDKEGALDATFETTETRYVDPAPAKEGELIGERDGETLQYGIIAVDHDGAQSEETKITVTTPRFATVTLAATEDEMKKNSNELSLKWQSDEDGFKSGGGKDNGYTYRETIIYKDGATDRSSTMRYILDSDSTIIEPDETDVTFEFTYYDKIYTSSAEEPKEKDCGIRLQYYKPDKDDVNSLVVSFKNDGQWKTATCRITDYSRKVSEGSNGFGAKSENSASFRLYPGDKFQQLRIHKVRMIPTENIGNDLMEQMYPPDPAKGASIQFALDASLDIKNCLSFTKDFERTTFNDGQEEKTCVVIPNDGDYMAFTIDDPAVLGDATTAKLTITYYAKGEVPYIDYNVGDGDGVRSNTRLESTTNTGEWKVSDGTFFFKNLPFNTKQTYNFLVRNTSGGEGPVYISEIKVEKVDSTGSGGSGETGDDSGGGSEGDSTTDPETPAKPDVNAGDPTQGASIVFGATAAEDVTNCITYAEDYERVTHEGKTSVAISDRSSMSFSLLDAVIDEGTAAKLTIEYYDGGEEPYIDYTTGNDGRKNTRLESPTGSGWESLEFIFTDLPFTAANYDFRINNTSSGVEGEPIYVSQIKVEKYEMPDPANGANIIFGATAANDAKSFITCVTDCERATYEGKTSAAIANNANTSFKLDSAVLEDSAAAKLTIEYYDGGEAPYIGYYSSDTSQRADGWKNILLETATGIGWKTVEFIFTDLPFTGSNYDFRINNSSSGDGSAIYVSQFKVEKYELPDPTKGSSIIFGNGSNLSDVSSFMSTYSESFERTTYEEKASVAITNNNSISFNIDDEVLADNTSAKLTIEYYDGGEAPYIGYYSSNGWKNILLETATGGGWKTVEFIFTELPFDASKNYNFRINNSSSGDGSAIYVSQIKVEKVTDSATNDETTDTTPSTDASAE